MNAPVPMPALDQKQDIAFSFTCAGVPENRLLVHAFTASEALFGLTSVEIALASHDPAIDLTALIDKPATLTIHHRGLEPRHLSGVVAMAERGDEGHHRTLYAVTLLPALHRLRHGSDCRIFQQKTVPEIVGEILKEHGIKDAQWHLGGQHLPREYCVQYRETHLAFIERLLAEEGIWYYFTHEAKGRHVVHFLDVPELAPMCPHQNKLAYNAQAGGAVKDVYCQSFSVREQVRSTAYTQRDYTFKHPAYAQEHTQHAPETNGTAQPYALYAYPGRYKQDAAGKPFTRHRMEAVRVDATTGSGHANTPHLVCGHRFALTDHPREACNVKHLLLSVEHHGSQPQALEEDAGDGAATYGVRFTTMPARLPYRPPLLVKPVVDGPQMAHVVGPPGEEIFTDEFGRVKIQFPWDRYGKSNDQSSCWIRVAQNWAGGAWGSIAIPRIGQEVVVDFLEGDPDQPIVTGRSYHAVNPPPYKLPNHKTRMTIKSKTHKGTGFNELRFEDEQGQEEIFMHAQKDMNVHVLNDRRKRIENVQHEHIGNDKISFVGGDHEEVIAGNVSIAVGSNKLSEYLLSRTSTIFGSLGSLASKLRIPDPFNFEKGNYQIFIEKNKSEIVHGGSSEIVGVAKSTIVANLYQITVGLKKSLIVRGRYDEDIGKIKNINVGDELNIRVGKHCSISMNKAGEVEIKGLKIKLKGSRIELN